MVQGAFRGGLSGTSAWAGVGLVVLALLSGCGAGADDVDPTPTPTTPPPIVRPEPAPEPTEEVPEEPVAPLPVSGTPDESDAEAAGEFFMRLYEYTLRTGDTEQWVERSLPGCEFCSSVAEDVEGYRADGARVVGVDLAVGQANFVAFDDVLRMFAVEVQYESAAARVIDADGEVIDSFAEGGGFLLFDIAYAPDTGWLLRTGG